ncbi:MAG TPA: hypothetical protein VHE35_03400 [Kofleriaceae bacterium]|nr:hypothetical protein [Kofleriaceae bacterium]
MGNDEAATESRLVSGLIGAGRAVGRLALKLTQVDAVIDAVADVETETRKRRRQQWGRALLEDEVDVDAFTSRFREGLRGSDADAIRGAVYDSIRAALEAVDDIVIPSMALLTRRHLASSGRDPDRRTYRMLLDLLSGLDDAEFRAISTAARVLSAGPGNEIKVVLLEDPGEREVAAAIGSGKAPVGSVKVWNWYTTSEPKQNLAYGEDARRAVEAVALLPAAFVTTHRSDQGVVKQVFKRPGLDLLADIMREAPSEP